MSEIDPEIEEETADPAEETTDIETEGDNELPEGKRKKRKLNVLSVRAAHLHGWRHLLIWLLC